MDNLTQEELNGAIQLEIDTLGTFCSLQLVLSNSKHFTEIGTKNENGFSIEECYEVNLINSAI